MTYPKTYVKRQEFKKELTSLFVRRKQRKKGIDSRNKLLIQIRHPEAIFYLVCLDFAYAIR